MNATYILEVRNSTGALVSRIITEYQNSIPIEETLTLETCTSYTVNVTVFVPSHSELGSHTDISDLYIPFSCSTGGKNIVEQNTVAILYTYVQDWRRTLHQ